MPEQPTAPELSALIGRPPEDIVDYFEDKGYQVSFRWRDTWREANAKAFTVAGVTKLDALKTIRGEVEKAISEGTTLREFKENLEPKLREAGFWGEREVVDEETGEVRTIDLSQPWRLRTIYQTNLQTSYMAGRWRSQQAAAEQRPYLMYDALIDNRTTNRCRERDGLVIPIDDPFWNRNYPPNHWGCRSNVRSVSEGEVEEQGIEVRHTGEDAGLGNDIATTDWAYNPGRAAFEPDLDAYDRRVARPYVRGALTGPPFRHMYDRLERAVRRNERLQERKGLSDRAFRNYLRENTRAVRGQEFPVAILGEGKQQMFRAASQTVRLSDDSLLKQIISRRGESIGRVTYALVQDVLERAQLVVKDQARHRVFIRRNDQLYHAVVKATGDRARLYLQSFRRTSPDDVRRLRDSGEVLEDTLEL